MLRKNALLLLTIKVAIIILLGFTKGAIDAPSQTTF